MSRFVLALAFAVGLLAVAWVGAGFAGSNWVALAMTLAIGAVYLLGAVEIRRFRTATDSLATALAQVGQPLTQIGEWVAGLPPSLQNAVRLRIEGERAALPGLALTPYLVGLLVMLGMLGTFLGMIVTFKGTVFALEGSTDLQAIRSALAAPIKGLGLSFGTSVAGVAASAMLGLMSAISRRERLDVVRQLDTRIATDFRPFSLVHQRQETFKALQQQAHALPHVASQLDAFMRQMEQRSQQLNEQLLERQTQFHRDATQAYTGLASAVEKSLTDSLTASARVAGESLRPVVEAAMTGMALDAQRMHAQVSEATQAQLNGLSAQFSTTAHALVNAWTNGLQQHTRTTDTLLQRLDSTLVAFTDRFDQRSDAWLTDVHQALQRSHTEQTQANQQRLDAWAQALDTQARALHAEWQRLGAQTLAQQQAVCQTLEATATGITSHTSQQARQTLDGLEKLLVHGEDMLHSRMKAEAEGLALHDARMDQLTTLWRTELSALRDEEAQRGQAAVQRLGELQAALASQLATLGTALEAPMTRLMHTAAEVPQAASGVIVQLREEMGRLAERDNQALAERQALLEQVSTLLHTLHQASGEQRTAIELLVSSAGTVLDNATRQFTQALDAQAGKADGMTAHATASAMELASLGEAFGHGVQLFSSTNEKLVDSLQRMEAAIQQSMARSDEQLAYCVAQAREVIDLSIASQQGIVEDLRRLHGTVAARVEGSA